MADRVLTGNLGKWGLRRRLLPAAVLAVVGLAGTLGCTRNFFRNRADEEVSEVLAEKDKYPAWRIEQFHVYPDPRARFADPTNPDCPPKPPDDPAAYDLAPNPQKPPRKAGVEWVEGEGYLQLLANWDAENRAKLAAAPPKPGATQKPQAGPPEQLPVMPPEKPDGASGPKPAKPEEKAEAEAKAKPQDIQPGGYTSTILASPVMPGVETKPGEPRPYLLNLEQALELALVNSREYQDERENLYLAALPVTLERFSFAAQFFAIGQAVRLWAGRQTTEGHQNNWQLNSNVGFSKLFSTGALLLFNFANQTVFNLGGGNRPVTSQSTINLDLIQPLLQGAGQAVNLEPLTQAERNLLYQIRIFARFRKSLYVAIAGGGGGSITGSSFQPIGVLAAGTFSPTSGVGSSGLIPGLIPQQVLTGTTGLTVSPGPTGTNLLQTALAAPVSGYLSTLLQAAQMQVDKYNIQKLESYFNLAKSLQEGGDISQLQTDTFEQNLLRGRQSLLTDQQNYLQAVDQFKLQLGLPTNLLLELDDTPFRPLNAQFQRNEDLFREFTDASNEPDRFKSPDQVSRIRQELRRILSTSPLVQGTRFGSQILARWGAWEKLSENDLRKRQATLREERRLLLGKRTDLEVKGQTLSPADQQRLADLESEIDLSDFELNLREYESRPWNKIITPAVQAIVQQKSYQYLKNYFVVVLIPARNERMAQLHGQWPVLSKLCVDGRDLLEGPLDEAEAAAAQHALANRLDLMNVRSQVVDAWRQLAIFANALLAPLNVQYSLTSTTPPGAAQPLNFTGNRTTNQLILNFQLPLVRLQQRNNYRASLINYQRSRRILMRAEDETAYDVRQELILLRQNLENYRIQTRQVELAYMTVENALDTLQAPPAPVAVGAPGLDVATRAASLTNQLIQAQNALYQSQFTMTTIWITYLNTRDQLYRDLELMPLDNRGVWIDDYATDCSISAASGRTDSGSCCPGDQRIQRLPEPSAVPPATGAGLEQTH
jgi:outer membrane protein TolC